MAQDAGIAGGADRARTRVTILLVVIAIVLALVLALSSLMQLLYLEALRLRGRDYPSLHYFKGTLQDLIGVETEDGATAFSLIKHTALTVLGIVFVAIAAWGKLLLWEGLLAALLLSWLTMIVTSYLIPNMLYQRSEMHWLRGFVPLAKVMLLIASPFQWLLKFIYSLVDLGRRAEQQQEAPDAAEHIEALISAGEEEGLIEEDDRKLIQSVVAFGDMTVREVMTPRPRIVAMDAGKALEELRQLVIHEQYSRIPVFEGNIDQVVGFVHVRDMFEVEENDRKRRTIRELMRPIKLVPETRPVNDLFREMQSGGTHMAVVIDEYGNTAGLVTMEDMVEVIVGEIHDEHEPERDVAEESKGVYLVSGSYDVGRLQELVGFRPDDETESTTVGGLASEWLGRVPNKGEVIEREGIRMEVMAADDLRVEQVRVSRSAVEPPAEGA